MKASHNDSQLSPPKQEKSINPEKSNESNDPASRDTHYVANNNYSANNDFSEDRPGNINDVSRFSDNSFFDGSSKEIYPPSSQFSQFSHSRLQSGFDSYSDPQYSQSTGYSSYHGYPQRDPYLDKNHLQNSHPQGNFSNGNFSNNFFYSDPSHSNSPYGENCHNGNYYSSTDPNNPPYGIYPGPHPQAFFSNTFYGNVSQGNKFRLTWKTWLKQGIPISKAVRTVLFYSLTVALIVPFIIEIGISAYLSSQQIQLFSIPNWLNPLMLVCGSLAYLLILFIIEGPRLWTVDINLPYKWRKNNFSSPEDGYNRDSLGASRQEEQKFYSQPSRKRGLWGRLRAGGNPIANNPATSNPMSIYSDMPSMSSVNNSNKTAINNAHNTSNTNDSSQKNSLAVYSFYDLFIRKFSQVDFQKHRDNPYALGQWKNPSWGAILIIIMMTISISVVASLGLTFLENIARDTGTQYESAAQVFDTDHSWIIILYTCFIAPFMEELVCRGVALNALRKRGPVFAIGATALLFGMMHHDFLQLIYTVPIGLLLGYIAYYYSIWWSMGLHMFNNLVLATIIPRVVTAFPPLAMPWAVIVIICFMGTVTFIIARIPAFIKYRKEFPTKVGSWKLLFTNYWFWIFAIYATWAALSGFVR